MANKFTSILFLIIVCCSALFSCKKSTKSTVDPTLAYFPLQFGKSVTYDVDSVYYYGYPSCTQLEVKSQMMYEVTDTYTDNQGRESYMIDVFTRPYTLAPWTHLSELFVTETATPLLTLSDPSTTSLLYTEDGTQYVKMIFPVQAGYSWAGNQYADVSNPLYSYLANWTYSYQNPDQPYNTGYVTFDHTVTVLEDDQTVNYPAVDSLESAYRTYAKEVYALNVGMIYKEWYHTTYAPNETSCLNGYSVVMRAIDFH